jgi:hypothetical protein
MKLNKLFKQVEDIASGKKPVTEAAPDLLQEEGFIDDEHDEDSAQLSMNPTRWEKTVVALNGIVKQVNKVDPDGLDIICFGGTDDGEFDEETDKARIAVFRGVKNAKDVEKMVTSKLPSGPCIMGKAMDYTLKNALQKGFDKRPCSILVLTAGEPDDRDRLEKSLKAASQKVAQDWNGKKEPPLSVTFMHIGDDDDAEKYMKHLSDNMVSRSKNRRTKDFVDIVDSISDEEIQASMKEIKGTNPSGKTGAVIGAFAGAAMGVGGMYLYNKKQAKKRREGWNGQWKSTFQGDTLATLKIKDDLKGRLEIEGFPGGKTFGRYYSSKNGYHITFRDADMGWKVTGEIENENTIYWADGTKWEEIIPKDNGGSWGGYAAATAGGAAAGGAVGYLLNKKFFNRAQKEDQCDYIIMVDRSAMMATRDKNTLTGEMDDDDDDLFEEYKPPEEEGLADKFNNLSTGQKVGVGVAGVAAAGGLVAAGVGIHNAVKKDKDDDRPAWEKNAPFVEEPEEPKQTRAAAPKPAYLRKKQAGFSGTWRSTYEGDTIADLMVEDDLEGILTIKGFMGGKTIGKYQRNGTNKAVHKINFIDSDEGWAVNGEVKGSKETVIIWTDGTRWDKISA